MYYFYIQMATQPSRAFTMKSDTNVEIHDLRLSNLLSLSRSFSLSSLCVCEILMRYSVAVSASLTKQRLTLCEEERRGLNGKFYCTDTPCDVWID